MLTEHGSSKFQCPHCNTIAAQNWLNTYEVGSTAIEIINHLYLNYRSHIESFYQKPIIQFLNVIDSDFQKSLDQFIPKGFSVATCSSCEDFTLWVNEEIVYPRKTTILPPNEDLEEDIKALYIEASTILVDSPKGSTALLRLALQKLLKQVGKSGKNINNDIKELVAEGLSKSNTYCLKLTLQRQHLDLDILHLRSPSSLVCLGTYQHTQDDGYDNRYSRHVPTRHKSIPLLDHALMAYQR